MAPRAQRVREVRAGGRRDYNAERPARARLNCRRARLFGRFREATAGGARPRKMAACRNHGRRCAGRCCPNLPSIAAVWLGMRRSKVGGVRLPGAQGGRGLRRCEWENRINWYTYSACRRNPGVLQPNFPQRPVRRADPLYKERNKLRAGAIRRPALRVTLFAPSNSCWRRASC